MNNGIVIIQGSARKNGHTKFFTEEFHNLIQVEIIDLKDYHLQHYNYNQNYTADDFSQLIKKLIQYNVWLIASPVYWYSVSGRTKVFLDRLSDLLQNDNNLGQRLKGKSLAVLSVSNKDDVPASFYQPLILSANYLGMNYLGHMHAYSQSTYPNNETKPRLHKFAELINKSTKK